MADPRFRVRSQGEVFDSSIAAWIPDPKTAAGSGGAGSTQVAVSSIAGVVAIAGNSTVIQGTNPWVISGVLSSVSSLAGRVLVDQNSSTWQVQIHGDSTVVQGTSPWVVAGASTVAPLAGSTWNTRPLQSSAADLQMTATPAAGSTWRSQPGSTLWASSAGFHFDSSGGLQVSFSGLSIAVLSPVSSVAPSSGSSAVVVRPVIDAIQTVVSSNAFAASTSFAIQSSGAGVRIYVTAFSITSSIASVQSKAHFYSAGNLIWPMHFQSSIVNQSLAVSAPAYLFRTNVAEAFSLRSKGTTQAGWYVGVSYFIAP